MPKKPVRKRRRKMQLPVTAMLWLAVAGNSAAGVYFSPATRANVIRIEGSIPSEDPRIQGILESVRGKPAMQVPVSLIESRILESEEIAGAKYSQNIFGRGLLKVMLKQPVAEVEGRDQVFLSELGDLYLSKRVVTGLPKLRLPQSTLEPGLSPFATWQSGAIATLCESLINDWQDLKPVVVVGERGVYEMEVEGGSKVILGTSEKFPDKLAKLKEMTRKESDLFSRYAVVNLTVPSVPMVVPK
ncbi:MAG: hypothetical protein J0L72_10825 [Armatimonadetes bacterium]|nr:hypothetical protein [Armatimonadota bacterium]